MQVGLKVGISQHKDNGMRSVLECIELNAAETLGDARITLIRTICAGKKTHKN